MVFICIVVFVMYCGVHNVVFVFIVFTCVVVFIYIVMFVVHSGVHCVL